LKCILHVHVYHFEKVVIQRPDDGSVVDRNMWLCFSEVKVMLDGKEMSPVA